MRTPRKRTHWSWIALLLAAGILLGSPTLSVAADEADDAYAKAVSALTDAFDTEVEDEEKAAAAAAAIAKIEALMGSIKTDQGEDYAIAKAEVLSLHLAEGGADGLMALVDEMAAQYEAIQQADLAQLRKLVARNMVESRTNGGAGSLARAILGLDTLWVCIAAFLVFFMQAGFGMVEAGFIRAKNAVNILTKNFIDYCSASIMFFLVGYAFMFGEGNGFIGTSGFALIGVDSTVGSVQTWAFWLFQAAFCGAAATIVAGGMAGRMKFHAYLLYTVVISGLVYPIVGHWIWGGGWLAEAGFWDFAGSTVVHATGGCAALVGTILLGPRVGKYVGGKVKAIQGHNIPLASLGVFILWFGWFGFNPGSTLAVGDGSSFALVAMNTNLAAAAGAITAMITIWAVAGKPDLGMIMNGCLAGLVAITAPCAWVSPVGAIVIGAIGGVLVVLGTLLLDRLRVDDPVGAFPVHGINGIWGTLSIGLFATGEYGDFAGLLYGGGLKQLGIQAMGTFSVVGFVVVSMGIVFTAIKFTVGLRVSRQEEMRGLDIGEHGLEAYAGFQVFVTE